MTQHDPQVSLRQMRDQAQEAIELARGKTYQAFLGDRTLSLAVVHLLEILGEAASRVAADDRLRYPGIPWPQIIGLRHRLIHGYDRVDLAIVWEIVTRHLPPLVLELEKALETGPADPV
jgi:uncharacterized protein with HEPN domain